MRRRSEGTCFSFRKRGEFPLYEFLLFSTPFAAPDRCIGVSDLARNRERSLGHNHLRANHGVKERTTEIPEF